MKLRRDEVALDPQVERELDALEAALAGEPVDPDLAGLAELATELREMRPAPDRQFAAALDESAAAGFGGGRRPGPGFAGLIGRLGAIPPRRALVSAGAGALTAVMVATAVVSTGGGSGTNSQSPDSGSGDAATAISTRAPSSAGDGPASSAGAGSGSQLPSTSQQPSGGSAGAGSSAENATADIAPAPAGSGPFASKQGRRAVERSAQLVLGTDPEGVRPSADRVFATVGRYGGIVLSSSIRDGGSGNAGAEFSLLIPSDRLSPALADLSAIAEIRSREESAQDITAPTVTVGEHLRDARAEVEGLLKQLANADTDSERASVDAQLRFQRQRVAALRSSLSDLRRRANFSRVSLQLVTGDAAVFPTSGEDQWTIGDAAHDAGRVLAVAAGVTLIGLSVLAPLALIGLLIWLARRAWVRAGRERVLEH